MIWNSQDSLFTTLRRIFGNPAPLLIVWGATLLAMPSVKWGAGHPSLLANISLIGARQPGLAGQA
jgi:hypothetical protein